jgi:hypothetical protein
MAANSSTPDDAAPAEPQALEDPSAESPDAAQETDVWWGAYATRAMLPGFVITGLVLVNIAIAAWYVQVRFEVDELAARYTAYLLMALVLGVQTACWVRRVITYGYRLTTRRLLLERYFVRRGRRDIELSRISGVLIERDAIERRLGVGRIRIMADSVEAPLILEGVFHPDEFASRLRLLAKQAREGQPAPGLGLQGMPLAAGHQEEEL